MFAGSRPRFASVQLKSRPVVRERSLSECAENRDPEASSSLNRDVKENERIIFRKRVAIEKGDEDTESKKIAISSTPEPSKREQDLFTYNIERDDLCQQIKQMFESIAAEHPGFIVPTKEIMESEEMKSVTAVYIQKTNEMIKHHARAKTAPVFLVPNIKLAREEGIEQLEYKDFKYTTKTFAEKHIRKKLSALLANKPGLIGRDGIHNCRSTKCLCSAFVAKFFRARNNVQFLKPTKSENFDLARFDPDGKRLVIECSDDCGCKKYNCKQRSIQRGGQVPLAIMKMNKIKGYGVLSGAAVKKGQLVTEITGSITSKFTKKDVDFEMAISLNFLTGWSKDLALCTGEQGNVARFMNHSCQPNAFFVECYSREKQSELYIPRVAVIALRNIKPGEEITIDYGVPKQDGSREVVQCMCGAQNCRGTF